MTDINKKKLKKMRNKDEKDFWKDYAGLACL